MSDTLDIHEEKVIESVGDYEFEPLKGQPMLKWRGKRPFTSTQFYPAQLKETFGEETDGWMNKIFWGDNLQVMSHLLKEYRGKVDLIYIDPPFDSKADYKKTIELRGKKVENDKTAFEEKQYTDIWSNDEYYQFMFERLILIRELLASSGNIYIHLDEKRSHYLKLIMDEVFGAENFRREIIWSTKTSSGFKTSANNWIRTHDVILYYTKGTECYFDKQYWPYGEDYIARFKKVDENGRKYRDDRGSGIKQYLDELKGIPMGDVWDDIMSFQQAATSYEIVGYPTQKPEALIERIVRSSSKEGDLVFDCFMGSGTTQTVAMKLGRRFIGADINLGSIDTTVKRLCKTAETINGTLPAKEKKFTGFEVYNVNNYDVFRNPVQAKELLIEALELQPLPGNDLYDGEKDGRMVKIMPINRIATRADLNELINGFPREKFDKIKAESPNKAVELVTLVCMGHEPDLKANLEIAMKTEGYKIDVEVIDILRDKVDLEFRRDSEAEIVVEGDKLVIREFYPMNLLQKLSMEKDAVDDWRVLVDSVKIDFNYDGAVFSPTVIDIPEGSNVVSGIYRIPKDAGTIKVKITDLLSESCEQTINI